MIIQGGYDKLIKNLVRQVSSFWDGEAVEILCYVPQALERMEVILNHLSESNKYVWKSDTEPVFSSMNSVQYAVFLYLLSNTAMKLGGAGTAEKVYYLNKVMHSCDWFYAVDLPEIFYAEHPIGSVMGKAKYGSQFFFYQGCTVGGNRGKDEELHYPVIGDHVLMYANSSILGNAHIGSNVIISTSTVIVGQNIPDCSMVFGRSPNITVKRVDEKEILSRQRHIWRSI